MGRQSSLSGRSGGVRGRAWSVVCETETNLGTKVQETLQEALRETIEDYAEQSSPHAALDSRVLGPSDLFGRRAEFCFFERRGVRAGVFERVCIDFDVPSNRIVQGGAKH